MALHRPDFRLIKANKTIDALDPENEKDADILYVLEKKEEWAKKQAGRIEEYQKVFDMMGKFIPSKGPTIYG